jgi:formyl-CoA transferase
MSSLPLEKFRVLDLTRVRSGPTAVRQFADWGAKVTMVESLETVNDVLGSRSGSDFQNLNRNKRSIALDLKTQEGREILIKLARQADVLFENFRPDVKFRLGIDFESLHKLNPRLVYVSISGYGQDGPYSNWPGFDQIAQGMGGLMSVTGMPDEGPMRAGIAVADSSAGLYAALGAMTALLERESTGKGRWVRTSLLQAQIAMMDFQAARWLIDQEIPERVGNDHPTIVPMGLFRSADGHINVAPAGKVIFQRFCEITGLNHLLDDERFKGAARKTNRAALNEEVAKVIVQMPSAYWIETLNAAGVPCGPVYRMDEVFADPQVQHLHMAQPVTHPRLGAMQLVGQPIEIDGVDASIRTASPDPGQHTQDILRELGYSVSDIAALKEKQIV